MTHHGKQKGNTERVHTTMLDGGARPWRVHHDPSRMFLNGVFRVSDLEAGGFDPGTIFIHDISGETCIVGEDGMARKLQPKKRKPRRVRGMAVRKNGRSNGGAANLYAIH